MRASVIKRNDKIAENSLEPPIVSHLPPLTESIWQRRVLAHCGVHMPGKYSLGPRGNGLGFRDPKDVCVTPGRDWVHVEGLDGVGSSAAAGRLQVLG